MQNKTLYHKNCTAPAGDSEVLIPEAGKLLGKKKTGTKFGMDPEALL